jgi:F0F1-type ATP synthase assembly protein I
MLPLTTETVRILIIGCLLVMALLAVLYLSQRRLSWTAYCLWGLLAVLLPVVGPFLVILAHPGQKRRLTQ